MSQSDSSIYKPFIWVLGALAVFTFLIGILANMFSPASDRTSDPLVIEGLRQQISPVGQSRVEPASEPVAEVAATVVATDDAVVEAVVTETVTETATDTATETEQADATVSATADAVEKNATVPAAVAATTPPVEVTDATAAAVSAEIPLKVRAVVATNCAGCHYEGVKGAQRSDDAAAWSGLAAKGLDALTASVINGKGEMMPRAETTLSDAELGLAVQHMIAQAVGESTGAAPVAAEEKSDTDAEVVVEPEATAEAEKTAEAAAETATEATPAVAAVAAVTATEVPANVKTVVDTLCAGCHISGVANAPKYGDKAAWDQRMAMGMDKLLASAIAGKGAMPARGGSQLSDAELQLAIEYMASK